MSANSCPGYCFVDTNILVYSRDSTESEKQARAGHWLAHLWAHELGRISAQVMNEYYVTVTRKLKPGLSNSDYSWILLRPRWFIYPQRTFSQASVSIATAFIEKIHCK